MRSAGGESAPPSRQNQMSEFSIPRHEKYLSKSMRMGSFLGNCMKIPSLSLCPLCFKDIPMTSNQRGVTFLSHMTLVGWYPWLGVTPLPWEVDEIPMFVVTDVC